MADPTADSNVIDFASYAAARRRTAQPAAMHPAELRAFAEGSAAAILTAAAAPREIIEPLI